MDTPSSSSTRRLTRSQTISRKIEESPVEKGSIVRRTKNEQDRCAAALIDITNDSPIVGVAAASLTETPLSGVTTKRRSNRIKMINKTPCSGSGEALLRGQVKALLNKVEEEGGGAISKISFHHRPFLHLQGFLDSPTGLIAPTPANTPQIPILNISADDQIHNANGCSSLTPFPVIEEQLKICQVVGEGSNESQKSVTRSLLMDFSEKSETKDDDSASNWSIQVNASSHDEDDYLDKVCSGIGKISINGAAKFEGKHKKFEYNSDDEIIVVELATPKGKHLPF